MTTMWRKLFFALVLAAVAAPAALLSSTQALTISPVVVEYEADPGQTVVGTVKLKNEGTGTETYYAYAKDFVAGDEAGVPQFLEKDSPTRPLAKYVSFDKSEVTLKGGESDLVIYRISIPESATPGGYFAGLLFGTSPPTATGVGAVAATGPLVLVRVSGNIVEKANLKEFSVKPTSATSLPVDFTIGLENKGTVHVKPQGVIRVTNMFGGTSAVIPVNELGGNVLPDSARSFMTTWQKTELPENASELSKEWNNFAFGPYKATLVMTYGETNQTLTSSTNFWVMPWMLIVLFIILVVVVVLLVIQYNKWIIARSMQMPRTRK